jgi:hypothetical protein
VSEPLARISLDVDGPRGPDVLCEIVVPAEWFTDGRRLQIDLPGRLTCANCSGGGCDACGRSGALETPKVEEPLELTLPSSAGSLGRFRVRIPGLGAESGEAGLARGHLLLTVRAGEPVSRGVSALPSEALPNDSLASEPFKATRAEPAFVLRILLMVVFVSLLFVFLLWFSGWM